MCAVNRLKPAGLFLFIWLALLLAAPTVFGQVRVLHLDGIQGSYPGAGVDKLYANDMRVISYSWQVDRVPDTNGLPGSITYGALTITKTLDQASPSLAVSSANATVFPSATVHVLDAYAPTPAELETITLSQVGLGLFTQTASGSSQPMETLNLSYHSMSWTPAYNPPNPAASGALYLLTPSTTKDAIPLVGDFSDDLHQATSPAAWVSVQNLSFGMLAATNHTPGATPVFPDLVFQRTVTSHSENFLQDLLAGVIFTNPVIDLLAYQSSNSTPVWYHLRIGQAWLSGVAEADGSQTIQMHVQGPVSWSYSLEPGGAGQNDTFAGSSGNRKTASFATATSVAASSSTVTLTWPAVAGATYEIVQSPQPQGPFTPVTLVTAASTGVMTYSITNRGPFEFYRVRLPFPHQ
jgi:type VI protein secretion system component Hcp